MTRARVAVAFAVVAALCLVGTAVLAVVTSVHHDAPSLQRVRDRATGATFVVPRSGWQVRDRAISYGTAELVRPAVFRAGYCDAHPQGSFRAVAGVTEQGFATWARAIGGGARATGQRTTLADGTPATIWRATPRLPADRCSSGRVEVVMVEADGVRLVVLADAGEPGTLDRAGALRIARSLELP